MTRIRDAGFVQSWEKTTIISKNADTIRILYHTFGIATFTIVIFQSIISKNIIAFVVWLVFGVVVIALDLLRGNNISIQKESIFSFFIILGTIFSIIIANVDSMFFIENLGRFELILYQIITGSCICARFFFALYFESFYGQEYQVLKAKDELAKKQFQMYKDNLIKTTFEFKKPSSLTSKQKWFGIFQSLSFPLLFALLFSIFALGYAAFIYFLIPPGTLKEYFVKPAFILFALLYTILLIRMKNILPELSKEERISAETETTED
ncbi:MAG: hypothetical protein ACTSQE_09255 [Candidatus Heimdallarchaeaceae archaeon]